MSDFSSQAGLSTLAVRAGMDVPVHVYAAVIEWPEPLSDASPALILARTQSECDEQIREEIRETADMLAEPDWRNVLDGLHHTDNWRDWLEYLEDTPYGQPFVTEYEQEV